LVLSQLAYLTLCRSIQLLVQLVRGDAAKDLEILVLRHQLSVLRRQTARPRLGPADRALIAAISRLLPRSRWSCFLVRPETLLGWHRRSVGGAWTYPHYQTGRPALDGGCATADHPPGQGEPALDPAPRRTTTTWRAFLPAVKKSQATIPAACWRSSGWAVTPAKWTRRVPQLDKEQHIQPPQPDGVWGGPVALTVNRLVR
jgi:hypothetical protein